MSTAKGSLTMMAMAILLITSIFSLRGLPSEAKYGIRSVFFFIFAAVVFLVPFSLVCAELASTYTKSGGLYRWVAEAFGPKWGWTAMYLEWQTVVFWFPTVLMFGAASLAYIAWPESFDQELASNKWYTLVVAMVLYWAATFNAFRGQKSANLLSTYGGLVGTIIPGALLAMALSFIPPSQIATGSPVVYVSIIAIGVAIFVALPLVIYKNRKPSWRNPDAHFYPFDWQIEGRDPGEVSKWAPGYEPTEDEVEAAETGAICKHGQCKHY